MANKRRREFIENIIAEVVARVIIGCVIAGFGVFLLLPTIIRGWNCIQCWALLAIPVGAGMHSAILGTRKGPGVI